MEWLLTLTGPAMFAAFVFVAAWHEVAFRYYLVTIDPATGEFELWLPHAESPHGPGLLLSELTSKSEQEDLLDLLDNQVG